MAPTTVEVAKGQRDGPGDPEIESSWDLEVGHIVKHYPEAFLARRQCRELK